MLPSYGVLIGTFDHAGQHQGQWLHEVLYVNANGQLYEAAVDVNEPNGIFQYMMIPSMNRDLFTLVAGLSDGWHLLESNDHSGAIDYVRSPFVQQSEGCLAAILGFLRLFGVNRTVWNNVVGNEAGAALETMVRDSRRLFIFGAPYANPNPMPGVHDIHMNQGDPIDSQWHATDGIWQDGCVVAQMADGRLTGYFGKFATQSLTTDSNGWPA